MSEIDPAQEIADSLARMRGFNRPLGVGRPGFGGSHAPDDERMPGDPREFGREHSHERPYEGRRGQWYERRRGGSGERGERVGRGGGFRGDFSGDPGGGFGADVPGSGRWPGPAAGGRRGAPALMRMLGVLARSASPLSVSDLGEAVGVDQPRASRLVAQAVEFGFVRREADPGDARRTRIALTDEGRAVAERMRGAQRDRIGAALEGFTEAERLQLAALLARLADAWSE